MFSFTAAVFAASLVYFAMSARTVIPRLHTASYISAVVMVSAFLELGALWLQWNNAFSYDFAAQVFTLNDRAVFSNGYRYANWLIDVPMLLTQFVVVLGFVGAAFWSRWRKLTILGVLMILTGYAGQYFEPQVSGFAEGNGLPFWIWGGVSWVFFFGLLIVANRAYKDGVGTLSSEAQKAMGLAWKILAITWFLYGFAYMIPGIPGINQSADWVVVRQLGYTVADVVSKTVFGIVLTRVAMIQSAYEDPRYDNGGPDRGLPDATTMPVAVVAESITR